MWHQIDTKAYRRLAWGQLVWLHVRRSVTGGALLIIDQLFMKILMSYSWTGSRSPFQSFLTRGQLPVDKQRKLCGTGSGRCQRPPVETKARAQTDSPFSRRGPTVQPLSAPLWLAQAFIHRIEVVQRGHNGPPLLCHCPLKASELSDMIERAQKKHWQLLSLRHFSAGRPGRCPCSGFHT